MIKSVSIKEVEQVVFRLVREKMVYDESIPSFGTRFPNVLESCLVVPFQKFDKRTLYKGFGKKAAVLFYLMIKNHPFQNGNKRIAMVTLFYFLFKNNKWLKIDNKKLYNFAVWLAESPAELKGDTLSAAEKFIKNHLVNK